MSESLLDKSSISCRKDLADFNLGFSKILVGGFSTSILCLVSIVQVVSEKKHFETVSP
jgi:hypothetical protein